MGDASFATGINCIDGRVQIPVADWLKSRFGVPYVDMVTEPGPDKVMALGPLTTIGAIKKKVSISVNAHHSRVVAVAGHHDCAANPIPKEEHIDYIKQAAERIASWDLGVHVIGLWVNDRWRVEVVFDSKRKVHG